MFRLRIRSCGDRRWRSRESRPVWNRGLANNCPHAVRDGLDRGECEDHRRGRGEREPQQDRRKEHQHDGVSIAAVGRYRPTARRTIGPASWAGRRLQSRRRLPGRKVTLHEQRTDTRDHRGEGHSGRGEAHRETPKGRVPQGTGRALLEIRRAARCDIAAPREARRPARGAHKNCRGLLVARVMNSVVRSMGGRGSA